jgi:hypothetical protein
MTPESNTRCARICAHGNYVKGGCDFAHHAARMLKDPGS